MKYWLPIVGIEVTNSLMCLVKELSRFEGLGDGKKVKNPSDAPRQG